MSAVHAPVSFGPSRALAAGPFTGSPGPTHVVQFYEDADFLAETVSIFLAAGWEAGAPLVVVARPDHLSRIGDKLRSKGIDAADARAAGRLAFLDADATLSTFIVDSMPDPDLFAAQFGQVLEKAERVGRPGALPRVYCEIVDLVWKDGNPSAAIRIEELWSNLGRSHPFALMCGYHMDRFSAESDAERFNTVCSTHANVGPAEGFSANPDDEARLREVSRLQQRERALETEIAYRKQLEEVQRQSLIDLRLSITERRELEQEREQLIDSLQRTVHFSEMFLGILGHDLRNPLHAIVTSASLVRRRSGDESLTKPIDRILSSADRMARMIDQLLDFTQIRLGSGIRLERRALDLRTVFEGVIGELEAVHGHCRIESEFEGDTSGFADEDRLAQLISNLTGNAIQHRVAGSAVKVRIDGTKADVLLLEFHNEGTVPPDMLPEIFEPFHGGAEKKTAVSSGLGLGLFISKQIVLAHGGRIDVVSSDAVGTRVVVALPRASGTRPEDAAFLPVSAEGGS
jgi:signal transduction histidine kinase